METIEERAFKAAKAFIDKRSYKLIEENFEFPGFPVDLVAMDQGEIVFIQIRINKKGKRRNFKPMNEDERNAFVEMMLEFLSKHEEFDSNLMRLDHLTFFVTNSDRALVEHHINVERPTI